MTERNGGKSGCCRELKVSLKLKWAIITTTSVEVWKYQKPHNPILATFEKESEFCCVKHFDSPSRIWVHKYSRQGKAEKEDTKSALFIASRNVKN